MIRNAKNATIWLLGCLTTIFALNRPDAPEISSVVYDTTSGMVTVTCSGIISSDDSCHVLFVTDFTTSLQLAYETANSEKYDGMAVTYAVKGAGSLSFQLDKRIRERYFVAAAVSHRDSNNISTFSAWDVYTDIDGLPVSFSTGNGDTPENLICRARRIGESGTAPVVADISFSLPTSDVDSSRLALYKNGTAIIDISLNTTTGVRTSIKDAVENTAGIDSTLILRCDTLGFSLFTVYRIADMAATDTLSVEVVRPDSSVLDTTQRKPGVISDSAYGNIQSTIHTLCRMPDTINPVYQSTLDTTSDSTVIRLLSTVMLDKAIVHNSPKGESVEEAQGLFTNYMQFFDEMVRNWGSIGDSTVGLPRFRMIFGQVLENNRRDIVDPVYARNFGTLSEYGKAENERENYAFYEGYTRFDVDLSFSGDSVPDVSTSSKTGIGLLFRVSENVSLFKAELSDTFSMFDSAFLVGTDLTRRIIIPTNDSLMLKFDSDGIWVKGNDSDEGEMQYYTGIIPLRLPLKILFGISLVDTAFSIIEENNRSGDPQGTIIGGPERSVMKVYELEETSNGIDTLYNPSDPSSMLHGQSRRIQCDSVYLDGDLLSFKLQTTIEDTGKMWLTHPGNYGITLQDTSVTYNMVKVLMSGYKEFFGKKIPTIVFEKNLQSKKLLFKNAENGILDIYSSGTEWIPICIEKDTLQLYRPVDGVKVTFTDNVALYDSKDVFSAGVIVPKLVTETNYVQREFTYNEFKNLILSKDTVYAFIKHGSTSGKISFTDIKTNKTESIIFKPIVSHIKFDLFNGYDPSSTFDLKIADDGYRPKFFRTLGGMAVKCSVEVSTEIHVTGIKWSTGQDGCFYSDSSNWQNDSLGRSHDTTNVRKTKIWWQSAFKENLNELCSLSVYFQKDQKDDTAYVINRFKSRILKQNAPILKGDDVRMLKCFLKKLGHSEKKYKTGVYGDVVIDDKFDENAKRLVFRFGAKAFPVNWRSRYWKNPAPYVVNDTFYQQLEIHTAEFKDAVNKFKNEFLINPYYKTNSDTIIAWIKPCKDTLKNFFIDTSHIININSANNTSINYTDIMFKWILQESGGLGHWGYGSNGYRLTISSEYFKRPPDKTYYSRGSIGFYQILSYHCYPYNPSDGKMIGSTLYNPEEYFRSFIRFTCTDAIAGNIYKAFKSYVYRVTKTINDTIYPHLSSDVYGNSYVDNSKDLLAKAFSGYNTNAFNSVFRNYTWPELLKRYSPIGGFAPSLKYSCELQNKLGLPQSSHQSSWTWVDRGSYTCKDTAGVDTLKDTVFTFEYNQYEYWHHGVSLPGDTVVVDSKGRRTRLPHRTWGYIRNNALKLIQDAFKDSTGNCLPCQ